jgi:FdhE protein
MSRTAAGLRNDLPRRLGELARERPEWQNWTILLQTAWRSADQGWWSTALDQADSTRSSNPEQAPLLEGHSLPRLRLTVAESLELIAAAICERSDTIGALAVEHGVDPAALGSVAQMAALPLLQACGHRLQNELPKHWPQGYCPICAAWPVLAERRGLDRSRRLRCGRCAADWEVEWLYCIYCGERDHRKLGSLAPEGTGDLLKVETCATCQGYLKSVASLQGLPPFELLLQDLETVELDLVALDRGYRRPHAPGFALHLSVADYAAGPSL